MYVAQSKGFEDPLHHDRGYRLKKALRGLKQAPRTWYERLIKYLLIRGYTPRGVDRTLFIRRSKREVIVVQIYVDDMVLGSKSQMMVGQFVEHMNIAFEMSLIF